MDIGTAKDMIEDMHHEIQALHKSIRDLVRVCEASYRNNEHHAGCLAGMMCTCGLMHYIVWKNQQQ